MRNAARKETLEEAAIRLENQRHAHRLKEIKTISKRLQDLQAYVPALKEAGVTLHADDIRVCWHKGPIGLMQGFMDTRTALAALGVFTAHGFKEADRHQYTCYATVVVQKGNLKVRLVFDQPAPVKAGQACPAQPA